jgi:hypothetical protein
MQEKKSLFFRPRSTFPQAFRRKTAAEAKDAVGHKAPYVEWFLITKKRAGLFFSSFEELALTRTH